MGILGGVGLSGCGVCSLLLGGSSGHRPEGSEGSDADTAASDSLTEALNTKPLLAWACAREVESPSCWPP